nr:farnesyl diphosphate synthase [Bacillus aquiflavi]
MHDLNAPAVMKEAMDYSLQAGGKRIRPLLMFATIAACNKDPNIGVYPAAALEMVHTYSLIHDDLPSMDNDDLRRGKPTNHKVFGEAFAVLAGDALLTYSFQLIADMPHEHADEKTKLELIRQLAKSAGAEGMVGGQTADIQGEGKQLTIQELEYTHIHKTGKLLQFSVLAGAILANASEEQKEKLTKFAHHLGLAFQIRDDILDVEGNEATIGKPLGSDSDKNKSTYPLLLSLDGAKQALAKHRDEACKALQNTGLNTVLLEEITNLIATRDH